MTSNPVEIFFSYSHKDEQFREECEKHLSMLKREGLIKPWHDRMITPGQEWKGQIDDNINTADIVLLLVTANFLASDYCYDIEMRQAMERYDRGEAHVIAIILTPVEGWDKSPFGKLQALPKDAKPVTKWDNQDEAFVNVAQGIRRTINLISQKRKKSEQESRTIESTQKISTEISFQPYAPEIKSITQTMEVFVSFSEKDEKLLKELENYLSNIELPVKINLWHKRKVIAGKNPNVEINKHLNSAQIILFLISIDFMNDRQCRAQVQQAIERRNNGLSHVIPVLINAIPNWQSAKLGEYQLYEFQHLPKNGKFVNDTGYWKNKNNALIRIAEEFTEAVKEIVAELDN